MFENVDFGIRQENFGYGMTSQMRLDFLKRQSPTDILVCYSIRLEMRRNIVDVFTGMESVLNKTFPASTGTWRFVQFDPDYWIIQNSSMFITGEQRSGFSRPSLAYDEGGVKVNRVTIQVYGAPDATSSLLAAIESTFQDRTFTKITWYYKDGSGVDYRSLYVDQDHPIENSYYPWFTQGVDYFINDYLKSSATVLLLYGPPGTGKTSFLKHLICSRKMDAIVSYDEDILQDDRFFIDFLADDENNLMIIEDADLLLSNRESEQNKIMSKFLNVSDGIVKVASKKMVFTTNISQIARVDPALLRKGRCYASVEFRSLTSSEAARAAESAGVPDQHWTSKERWTLSEVFNQDITTAEPQQVAGFGFRA